MSDLFEIVIRAFIAFFLLSVIIHFIGKQIIAQMTTYQFVGAITLGSIAGNMVFNLKINLSDFFVAILMYAVIIFLFSYLDLKTKRFRKYLSGEPTMIIQDGKILEHNMKHLKLTMDSLKQALRGRDIFNIDEVEYALIEANGTLSVLKKPLYRPITRQDLNLSVSSDSFPVELIIEGTILEKNLTKNKLLRDWLLAELSKRGLISTDVFYGVKGSNGQLYFDLYHDQPSSSPKKPLQ
ncbi:MAG TPA: DUF421 domain-containing protein [Bacillota bacterium]|nr:DUF421 domain-containing protein [Bacillota bacterium]